MFKSSIIPLIFTFITYYYFAKRRPYFLKQISYIYFIIFVTLFFFLFFFSLTLYFWNSNLYSRFLILAFWYLLSILYLYFFFIIFVTFFLSLSFFLVFFYITLYIWNSKLYSRFLIYAFWYFLSILYLYFLYNFCDFVCFCLFVFCLSFSSFFLTLYFWNSKLYSRFLTFAFWYLLSTLYLYFLYNFCDFVCFCLFVFSLSFPSSFL